MTNLEQHTTNLEQSKKLYELGFRRPSEFYRGKDKPIYPIDE